MTLYNKPVQRTPAHCPHSHPYHYRHPARLGARRWSEREDRFTVIFPPKAFSFTQVRTRHPSILFLSFSPFGCTRCWRSGHSSRSIWRWTACWDNTPASCSCTSPTKDRLLFKEDGIGLRVSRPRLSRQWDASSFCELAFIWVRTKETAASVPNLSQESLVVIDHLGAPEHGAVDSGFPRYAEWAQ